MAGAPSYRWMPFIAGAVSIVGLIFGVFWLLETRLLGSADREVVAAVHLVVGFGTSLVVLFYGLYFVLDRIEAAEAHADRARQSERYLFSVFDNLPVAVFVLDHDGSPTFANQRALELLGSGADAAKGVEDLADVYEAYVAGTDEPYPTERLPIVRALRGEADALATDLEVDRDGRRIPLEVWASPVRDAEGRVSFAIGVFVDVTDRRRAEEEKMLRVAREKDLEKVRDFDRLRSRFINMAAHELYTPITPIKLQVEALRKTTASGDMERAGRSLDVIHRNVNRLHTVVHQILEVARIEAGRVSVRRERIDLGQVVERALAEFDDTARHRRLDLETDIASGIVVDGDSDRLENGVANLLENVAKHTPKGTKAVVRCHADGDHAVVEVVDHGPGFGEEVTQRLFEPFHQADEESGDMEAQGWGLGLFVTRSVVEQHDGEAWCRSRGRGEGTEAGFRIPLAQAKDAPAATALTAKPS